MILPLQAQENSVCLTCHEDKDLTGTRDGKEISVFVDEMVFSKSVHADMSCIDCHTDLKGVEDEHSEDVKAVNCVECHDDAAEQLTVSPHGKGRRKLGCTACHGYHDVPSPKDPKSLTNPGRSNGLCGSCHNLQLRQHNRSLHGRAAAKGDKLAPTCVTCHEHHAIRSANDPRSPTTTLNIPLLCGKCHHEGTEVSLLHDIPQDRILENYSFSIHGVGLFKKGLIVTAVCTSCHTSHEILEHTNPRSSISPQRVAATCTQCHARIEEVHTKVIEGRLWEEEKHKIPACVECHSPHKIRRITYQPGGAANKDCLKCHGNKDLTMERGGKKVSLYVDEAAFNLSDHSGKACAQCHTEVRTSLDRPCNTIKSRVDCSICHAEVVQLYNTSAHGKFAAKGDPDAPGCLDCHDNHYTMDHNLPTSPTFARNVPQLCARCHRTGEKAAKRIDSKIDDIVGSYEMSIHGKGLVESGLVVSATCTNCHSTHNELPASDPKSKVNPANIADTCGTCHHGIKETFEKSIHWPGMSKSGKKLPTCESCHTSHTISRTDIDGFRNTMMNQCGNCHIEEADTFFDTYHGKVSRLGAEGAAKCYDCHGIHDILPVDNPDSHLGRRNVVKTCARCHSGAHRKFTGYLTHATHHDPDKYPWLFYAFWFMTILLVSVLTFSILHTLAWLFRLWRIRKQWRPLKRKPGEKLYMRFNKEQRVLHLLMILSFFTLAITGMALKFSYMGWAQFLSEILGGFESMGYWHRSAALIQLGIFVYHLWQLRQMKREEGKTWRKFLFGPDSMVFNKTDLKQLIGQIKWFFGKGERPKYGRYTYWEKFDYFAVFWGIFIIGSTGLMLWFPEFFTYILPGWSINVATIIHSDEALLAVGFIFTVHFFNTHFRPDKFPIDPVIFTGRITIEELKHDKPAEYEALVKRYGEEGLQEMLVEPIPDQMEKGFRFFGFIALGIGIALIFLIIYAMLFGYR
jgi:predicted CXXCH cytochrome family protein